MQATAEREKGEKLGLAWHGMAWRRGRRIVICMAYWMAGPLPSRICGTARMPSQGGSGLAWPGLGLGLISWARRGAELSCRAAIPYHYLI